MRAISSLLLLITLVLSAQAEPAADSGIYSAPATALRGAAPLETYAGGPSVVILFQPHCAWCQVQFRAAGVFSETYPDVPVVAVSLKGRRADLIEELRKARTDIPAYRSSPALLDQLGDPAGTPRVYVLAPDGSVSAWARGAQSEAELEALVWPAGAGR